jgi:hypothetical protein
MDINKLRWWQPKPVLKYPHFNQDDSKIWDSFLISESKRFIRFSYDVPLIDESRFEGDSPDFLESDWNYLTAYKIDVIGETLDSIILFEVKPILSHMAIGQINTYSKLFKIYYSPNKPIVMSIVCLSAPSPLIQACNAMSIMVYVEPANL